MQCLKKLPRAAAGIVLLASVTACTPSSDPVLEKILNADLGALILQQKEVKGYCYPTELFCSEPLFEPVFTAPAETDAKQICEHVVQLQSQLGLKAFSTEGSPAIKVNDKKLVQKMCTDGLSNLITAQDGSTFYEGMVLFDDGNTDGVGKVTTIHREPNGNYSTIFSISRNLDRVGWIPY